MNGRIKKMIKVFLIVGFLVAVITWICVGNYTIKVTHLTIENKLIPKSFEQFVIVQVSDLHNTEFGSNQQVLVQHVKNTNPDIIAITGDLIDSNHPDIKKAMDFVKAIAKIAPVYFVTGNHEAWTEEYGKLKTELQQVGVVILDNEAVILEQNDESIQLMGVSDPDFVLKNDWFDEKKAMVNKQIQGILEPNHNYKILLSHRPELVDVYAENSINLVLCGHAHGGQVRIPFLGGLVAPDQGFFPKYTEGVHNIGETQMVVSRGLGNSIIPIRINNQPELVVITLKHVE